jgi:hypothetical protein
MTDAPALVAYWIPWVGIPDNSRKVAVPMTDILNWRRKDGAPQITEVILGAARFRGRPGVFDPPYLDLEGLAQVLPPKEAGGPVQQLRAQGIKVLLSVYGRDTMGWDHVPASQNGAFAQWGKEQILDKLGLDGIDVDNEWCTLGKNRQGLVDTVAALRAAAPQALISKALWDDADYFKQPVSPTSPWSPGRYLGQLLDFASTMAYGNDAEGLEAFVEAYTSIKLGIPGKERDVGMSKTQLCIGVQAGVGNPAIGDWFTTLDATKQASAWVVQEGYRGMMLYTFTSDIQQWTHEPQNAPGYLFPNANDHEWQRAITAAMGVAPAG